MKQTASPLLADPVLVRPRHLQDRQRWFRKTLSFRQFRYGLAYALAALGPSFRRRYAAYVKTVAVEELATRLLLATAPRAEIALSAHQRDFIAATGYEELPLTHDGALPIGFDEDFHELTDCVILGQTAAVLHRPSERIVRGWRLKSHRNIAKPFRYRRSVAVEGLAYSALSPSRRGNYFHVFFDRLMPAMRLLGELSADETLTYVMRDSAGEHERVAVSILQAAHANLRVQEVSADAMIEVERLVYRDRKVERLIDYMADAETLRAVRRRYHDWAEVEQTAPTRRLLISRAGQKLRRLTNEDEVLAALQPLGFERVAPETLSPAEQVRLFAAAEIVVGSTGGALANLLFCRPGSRVIETRPADGYAPFFVALSAQMGLTHLFHAGSLAGAHRSFSIDPEKLAEQVRQAIADAESGFRRKSF